MAVIDKRTLVRYLPKESINWSEARWDREAAVESDGIIARSAATVTDQRKIQWGPDPRIETDFNLMIQG